MARIDLLTNQLLKFKSGPAVPRRVRLGRMAASRASRPALAAEREQMHTNTITRCLREPTHPLSLWSRRRDTPVADTLANHLANHQANRLANHQANHRDSTRLEAQTHGGMSPAPHNANLQVGTQTPRTDRCPTCGQRVQHIRRSSGTELAKRRPEWLP